MASLTNCQMIHQDLQTTYTAIPSPQHLPNHHQDLPNKPPLDPHSYLQNPTLFYQDPLPLDSPKPCSFSHHGLPQTLPQDLPQDLSQTLAQSLPQGVHPTFHIVATGPGSKGVVYLVQPVVSSSSSSPSHNEAFMVPPLYQNPYPHHNPSFDSFITDLHNIDSLSSSTNDSYYPPPPHSSSLNLPWPPSSSPYLNTQLLDPATQPPLDLPLPTPSPKPLDFNGRPVKNWKGRSYKCSHCDRRFQHSELHRYARHVQEIEAAHGPLAINRTYKCLEPSCEWSKIGFTRKLEFKKHYARMHSIPQVQCPLWRPGNKEAYAGAARCTTRWHTDTGSLKRHLEKGHNVLPVSCRALRKPN